MGNSINNIKFLGRKFFGIRNLSTAPTYDADAQAYFNANTAITSTADKNAINTFYLGLKSDGIYTKIKAMYLPIWGSASASKWNLVNPLDTNAAFRISFATGMTFTSGGMTSNGTSGYADTWLNSSTDLTLNNTHISFYSRTNNTLQQVEIGSSTASTNQLQLACNYQAVGSFSDQYNVGSRITTSQTDSRGLFLATRTSSSSHKLYKNGSQIGTTNTSAGGTLVNLKTVLLATNVNNIVSAYSTKQCSFASIGDGLTDTEASNFSNRVNTLMAYFGINTYPVVSDADAQAYINANDAITNQSDANAINTFFTGLKSDGIYTKIKAMYLPIWGSASSSKWNLVNPLDTDAAFRLTFSTGWTFSSSGMTPNGTSAYANTNLKLITHTTSTNISAGSYSRTNNTSNGVLFGAVTNAGEGTTIFPNFSGTAYYSANNLTSNGSLTATNTTGFFITNKFANTTIKFYRNGSSIATFTPTTGNVAPDAFLFISARTVIPSTVDSYDNRQQSFIYVGNTLTDTEATNFYNRVNTLMTYFGINV